LSKKATPSAFDRWYRDARKARDAGTGMWEVEYVLLPSVAKKQNVAPKQSEAFSDPAEARKLVVDLKRSGEVSTVTLKNPQGVAVKDGPLGEFLSRHGLRLPAPDSAEAVSDAPKVAHLVEEGDGKWYIWDPVVRGKYGPYDDLETAKRKAKESRYTDFFVAKRRGDSAKDAAAVARAFDKAHWVADNDTKTAYTGMRGNWFLTARRVRSKDGTYWVSYARHKDTKERRIAGSFKGRTPAMDAAVRLAVGDKTMDKEDPAGVKKRITELKARRAQLRGSDPEEIRAINDQIEELEDKLRAA